MANNVVAVANKGVESNICEAVVRLRNRAGRPPESNRCPLGGALATSREQLAAQIRTGQLALSGYVATRPGGCRRLARRAPKQSLVAILPAATVPKTLRPHRRGATQ